MIVPKLIRNDLEIIIFSDCIWYFMFSDQPISRRSANYLPGSDAEVEARTINCVRVICITFMMFTHLKEFDNSVLYGGDLNIVGVLVIDYLGRASVPALSLISGYLLARGFFRSQNQGLGKFAVRKANRVLVPMVIWNLVYITLVLVAYMVLNSPHRVVDILRHGGSIDLTNMFLALTGSPANFTLHFIRDLFVGQILLYAILRLCGGLREFFLIGLGAYALIAPMDPLISRELIIVFLVVGALLPMFGVQLIAVATSRAAQIFCLAMLAVLVAWGPQTRINVGSYTYADLIMRSTMSLAIVILGFQIARLPISRAFAWLAPISFMTYLLHLPVTSFLWSIWGRVFPGNSGPMYVVYFFAAPTLAWLIAIALRPSLKKAPRIAMALGLKA